MKRKHHQVTKKRKKSLKRETKHIPNTIPKSKPKPEQDHDIISDYEEADLDLTQEVHPIEHYINNRKLMIETMFSIIKGNELKSILPPILQDVPGEEIKTMSLDVLECMSRKRIQHILAGKEMTSSSESEDSCSEFNDDSCTNKIGQQTADSTSVDTETGTSRTDQVHHISYSDYAEPFNADVNKKTLVDSLKLCPDSEEVNMFYPSVKVPTNCKGLKRLCQPICDSKSLAESNVCDTTEKYNPVATLTRDNSQLSPNNKRTSNEMEILELELRAKAIRALMKVHE